MTRFGDPPWSAKYSEGPALAAGSGPGLCCFIVDRGRSVGHFRPPSVIAVAIWCLVASGCDPILNVQGSFFPAWIICMGVGGILTAVLRQLFVILRLEPNLGPLLLVYPSVWLLTTMLTWLVFYRT